MNNFTKKETSKGTWQSFNIKNMSKIGKKCQDCLTETSRGGNMSKKGKKGKIEKKAEKKLRS